MGFDNYAKTSFTFSLIAIGVTSIHRFDENESVYYCAPAIHTIINAWCLARFWYAFDVMYPVDVFTVYFLLWKCMFIKLKWDYSELPLFSVNLYRVSICWAMAPTAFFIHDVVLRYSPNFLTLALFLERVCRRYVSEAERTVLFDAQSCMCRMFYTTSRDLTACVGRSWVIE